ncbi:hypothetical protein ACJJIE_14295 [Microbulbifer sp. TRSA001]|uniref:hypothetical protein n=1 Tax=unclassified Microbulbifer TaxID=2619833 RepID=UPI00403AE5C0
MAIEIYYDSALKGTDIRGAAIHLDDVLHEQLINLCVSNEAKYSHLVAIALIEDDQCLDIDPGSTERFILELRALMDEDTLFEPVKPSIERFICVLNKANEHHSKLNVYLD